MCETRIENQSDMFIVKRIEHLATIATRLDQVRRTQDSQLVAYHGLFHIQFFGNIVHRNFASFFLKNSPKHPFFCIFSLKIEVFNEDCSDWWRRLYRQPHHY